MTKNQVQTAINEGIPFVIKMVDGEKYEVHEKYQIAVGKTTVVVLGEGDLPHILPLLTMTGISYLPNDKKSEFIDQFIEFFTLSYPVFYFPRFFQ